MLRHYFFVFWVYLKSILWYNTYIFVGVFMKNLSVIVPIYNKENFLEDSLNSLLNGVAQDTELLLIDDHSTDGSFSIAQDFSKRDSRIRLLKNNINSGVGYTRNKGMREASGEYIGFFDADDRVDYGFYDQLYQKAISKNRRPDIVAGGFRCFSKDNLCIGFPFFSFIVEDVPFSIQRRKFASRETVSCCNKIYHHDFLDGKYFTDYIKEDVYFHYWTTRDARIVFENRLFNYYYYSSDTGRNLSYYHSPNGDFYDLVEGGLWLQQKIGREKDLLSSFCEVQLQAFVYYIQSIAKWNIPIEDQVNLIGTLIEYCESVYQLDPNSLDPVSQDFYQTYRKSNSSSSIECLKQKLMRFSYEYPNRRKK